MGHAQHTILVVDDESSIRDLLRDILAFEGHQVHVATNGHQALEQLRGGGRPCVVLMDLVMPGMNGWELAARIHADPALAEIPLVVIAANPRHADDAARIGAERWLGKPLDLDRLFATVDELCVTGQAAPIVQLAPEPG